jgi:hypothetical protein
MSIEMRDGWEGSRLMAHRGNGVTIGTGHDAFEKSLVQFEWV